MLVDLPLLAPIGFVLTHLLLGLPPLRTLLMRGLGEQRFVALFSFTAALTLALVAFGLIQSSSQDRNPWLLEQGWLRLVLGGFGWLGMTLALAALPGYPKTPMALFQSAVHEVRGISKISRHSFFVGFALFAGVHSLLVSARATWMMLIAFAVLSLLGALIQDRKLLMRHGEPYRRFMQTSSVLPFLALIQGRTQLLEDDRIGATLLRAAIAASVLVFLHPLWSIGNGAALPLLLAIGGFWLSFRRWQSAQRRSEVLTES